MKRRILLITFPAFSLFSAVGLLDSAIHAHAAPTVVGQWTQTNGPYGGGIYAFAVKPVTPTTVYAGSAGHGVSRSTNGGASWSAYNMGLPFSDVQTLAIGPLGVYAGIQTRGEFVFEGVRPFLPIIVR